MTVEQWKARRLFWERVAKAAYTCNAADAAYAAAYTAYATADAACNAADADAGAAYADTYEKSVKQFSVEVSKI